MSDRSLKNGQVLMQVQSTSLAESAPTVRKERLIEAAMTLFGEHGFAGTSVRDVAEAAGTKMGSLYNFFEDKRGLYIAVIEKAYGLLHDYVQEAKLVNGDAVGNLRRVFSALTQFFLEQRMAHRVILQEMLVNAEQMDRAIDLHLRSTRAVINGIVRDGIRSGTFRAVDVEMFSYGLLSAMFGYFTSRALFMRLFAKQQPMKRFAKGMPFPLFDSALQDLCAVSPPNRIKRSKSKS